MHGRSNDEEQDDSDTDKQTEEPQQNVEIGRKRKMSWADTVSLWVPFQITRAAD